MPGSRRTWLGALLDRTFTWMNSLPVESCSYTVESFRIPVDKNLELTADLYQTLSPKPKGTLLVRTPYGLGIAAALGTGRFFAAQGYHVLMNACRGTSGSDGQVAAGTDDVADGQAVVAWMRKQHGEPKDMKAAAIFTGPDSMQGFLWSTGAMQSHIIIWADLMPRMTRGDGMLLLMWYMRSMMETLQPVFDSVPLVDGVSKYLGEKSMPEWLHKALTVPNDSWPGYEPPPTAGVLEKANIPILQVTGWYDSIFAVIMHQYYRLLERGVTVRLVIGPWTHLGAQGRNVSAETLPWVEEHLAGGRPDPKPAVRYFLTGKEEWREVDKWPPVPRSRQQYFLDTNDRLSLSAGSNDRAESSFMFDPANPTPSTGSPQAFAAKKGRTDENNTLIARSDVISFTSPPLTTDIEVMGQSIVTIHHSTDNPHADLRIILSEVDSKTGISRQVSEYYRRLDPKRSQTEPLNVSLHDIAHVFRKGNRIRLSVAGGSHPKYIRNIGSRENPGSGTTLRSVTHTVKHHTSAVSVLFLPVTSGVDM
ncbi:Cocaine esterase [Cyphellophora attinorum]|uniref:Cocaine esterase n=1 Tax=Cyphellophora attinorum TaxID=1664694 RepID=A0A0N1HIE6_9EURO|nr:Cocaine esterase [Phialophora attinorum]KPI46110.1 Cocaine esterase [Phialophora attinorum]